MDVGDFSLKVLLTVFNLENRRFQSGLSLLCAEIILSKIGAFLKSPGRRCCWWVRGDVLETGDKFLLPLVLPGRAGSSAFALAQAASPAPCLRMAL